MGTQVFARVRRAQTVHRVDRFTEVRTLTDLPLGFRLKVGLGTSTRPTVIYTS